MFQTVRRELSAAPLLGVVVDPSMAQRKLVELGQVISRIIEAILSIPVILMAILVVFTFGQSRPVIIGTIAVLFVPAITRTIRSAAIAESQLDYVTSAKMRGETGLFIVGREILQHSLEVWPTPLEGTAKLVATQAIALGECCVE